MTKRKIIFYLVVIFAVTAGVLLAMGRVPICACGQVWLWSGDVASSNNSQHLSDAYTFTHIIHGIGFYAFLWWIARRRPWQQRLLAATIIEALWEIVENGSWIIERYRAATISLNYYGDSVVNSMGDILAMMIGFAIAAKLPVKVTIGICVVIELFLLYWIRDSLVLNIIMLIYPVPSIKQWQMGA